MGLGKTIQSITFLYEIYLKGIHGPFLVIAPLSTIPNWEREFRTWTELNVVVYHGSQASRRTIQLYEMYFKDPQVRALCAVILGFVSFFLVDFVVSVCLIFFFFLIYALLELINLWLQLSIWFFWFCVVLNLV